MNAIWDGRCPKHGCEMMIAAAANRRHHAPLHRCAECCAEFCDALRKAKDCFKHRAHRVRSPAITSERRP